MKKIISAILMLTMLVSVCAVSASADGQLYTKINFDSPDNFQANFHPGAYEIDDVEGYLLGYADAMCLQTVNEWYQYDAEIEVCFADDDLSEADRAYSLWYPNTNPQSHVLTEGCVYMKFGYDITNKQFYLTADDYETEEVVDLLPRVPADLEDGEFHKLGFSVSDKCIRGFYNGELIFDYVDTADKYLIGRQDEKTVPTAMVYWNDGNFVQIKEVQVASAGYLYPIVDAPVTSETAATEATTTKETTTRVETSVVVKDDGQTEIVTEVITEATTPAPAATNTGKPAGGSSTATGDATFIVVAAMVATLGCALIIRKVNA